MNTFFTADTHFSHGNIIKYCNRPFADAHSMNQAIVRNWNAVVADGDLVYHLGDFCFGREEYQLDALLNQLKGRIVLIKGNHDSLAWRYRRKFFGAWDSYLETEVQGQEITLCHYAMRVWNKSHRGSWHLYGHSHGSLPDDPHARAFDVGVDCHDFAPISFNQVQTIMNRKLWKPIDHHGENQEGGGVGLSREEYAKAQRRTQFLQLKKEFENV